MIHRQPWKSHSQVLLSVLTGGSKGVHQRTSTVIQKLWQNLGRRLVWFQTWKLMKMNWVMNWLMILVRNARSKWNSDAVTFELDNGPNMAKLICSMTTGYRTVCHQQGSDAERKRAAWLTLQFPYSTLKVMVRANNTYNSAKDWMPKSAWRLRITTPHPMGLWSCLFGK